MNARRNRPVTAVTIAASDSGGGAGIQADLLTFAAHGVYGATIITAATAQNTVGITGVEPLSAGLLRKQIDAVFPDFKPSAVKIGALYDAARIREVAAGLKRHRAANIVLDPVLAATTGVGLLAPSAIRSLVEKLFPLCDLVTPNLTEAEKLAAVRVRTDAERREAARILVSFGCRAVLIKGGHAAGARVTDLFYDGRRFREVSHPRISTLARHGTGCTLSSAIAANLALGHGLEASVRRAVSYLAAGLSRGIFPGRGSGVPDHFPTRRS
jgi:hydroxymethylpyrimidine/phosphomethylpyrimidine kinase